MRSRWLNNADVARRRGFQASASPPPHPHCSPAGFGVSRVEPAACLVSTALPLPAHCGGANFSRLGARTRLGSPHVLAEGKVRSFIFACVFIYGALNSVPLSFRLLNAPKARQSMVAAALLCRCSLTSPLFLLPRRRPRCRPLWATRSVGPHWRRRRIAQ